MLKLSLCIFRKPRDMDMKHYTTLSSESKVALQSGDIKKMQVQLKKLQHLYGQRSAITSGPLRRHLIAMKNGINDYVKRLTKVFDSSKDISGSFLHPDYFVDTQNVQNERETCDPVRTHQVHKNRDTLNQRWMRNKKAQQVNTTKKAKAVSSLNETIYKHYYQKLTKLTKMRADPVNSAYMDRAKARGAGFSAESNSLSYEEKFRILLYKMNIKWKPRDYVQRKCDFRSLFSRLCTSIMDCVKKCTSIDKGGRLDAIDRLDNLFRILRRFKISSPIFSEKRVYRGGGPKKCLKKGGPKFEYWGKRDVIGKDKLSVPVMDSLSNVLRKQFKSEYGLLPLENLYKASQTSGPISSRQKRFNLRSVPIGQHAVQMHFCSNHYVTSEQKPSGIVVWDSLQTTSAFKAELYPQLRLTYDILSQYSEAPKGLIKYVTDSNNKQNDTSSCGIYAVLRAYFIFSHKSSNINTDVARSYLSSVLVKGLFTDYDSFSVGLKSSVESKMETMMENYMHDQKELQSKKLKTAQSHANGLQLQVEVDKTVKKRGRPKKYTTEELKERIKVSKLAHYHKCNASGSKRGRPSKYSPEEKINMDRGNKLKYYHKVREDKKVEITQKRKDRQKSHKRTMRQNPAFREKEREKIKQHVQNMRKKTVFRDKEKHNDRVRHEAMRKNTVFRDKERLKDRLWHQDIRQNSIFRNKERHKDRLWHEDTRQNLVFREIERNKDRERHKDNRADSIKRRLENLKTLRRKYGINEQDAIKKYLAAIQTGPNVVCTCCLQLWFPDNCTDLAKVTFPYPDRVNMCKTGTMFEGKEWLCSTCIRHLKEDRIPPLSHANGMKFCDIPEELRLVQMEERCIALRQPFFQIRELPNGGQKSIKGNVVNVPMDVSKTINQLPRNLNETETIGIKFKKKVSYKKCDYYENIRPKSVIKAARYLIKNSDLYKAHNVRLNETWEENIHSNTDESYNVFIDTANRNKPPMENNACTSSTVNMPNQSGNSCPNIIEIDLTMSDNEDSLSMDNGVSCVNTIKMELPSLTNQLPGKSDKSSKITEIDLTVSDEEDNNQIAINCEKTTNDAQTPNDNSIDMTNTKEIKQIDAEVTDESDDNFSEIDEMEGYSGNMDTMLDSTVLVPSSSYQSNYMPKSNSILHSDSENGKLGDTNTSLLNVSCSQKDNHVKPGLTSNSKLTDADALVIAPGEGQRPIALFNDPDAEYLAFPSIYCGERRPIDDASKRSTKKRPSIADIYKWELRAQDRRVATCVPNIFFKVKCLQTDTVENVVGISVRKVQGKTHPTAGELKTPAGRDKLRNLHEGVNMFRKMRNTPPYYSSKKKCLLAMVRQGGMPSLFFTQSCADTNWPELLKVLGQLVDNRDYTDQELEKLSYIDRNRLVAADPVTVVRYFENKCHQFQKHIMNLKGSYKHFLRREFQHRGSPHSHEIHWINEAPIYDPNKPENDKNVINFIDSWISTKVEVHEDEKKYLKYQIHKHSTSCRKRGEAICRFGIPFFPMQSTAILKPLEDSEIDEERLQTLKNSYQDLRTKLNDMGEGLNISHEQFLDSIEMSQAEYILAIRSSLKTAKVFYERKPNALRVNPYMKGMLAVIRANHDVQYPLDIYALVCYVADYLLKSQKGLSATLEQACMDVLDGNMRLKQQIRHIGYKLLSTIETSAPEACYYIMQIPFTRCSVEVVFIPTSPPEDRTYILKSETELSELPEESRDVLKSNIITSYAKRPKQLQHWCLADYVSELTVHYHKNETVNGSEQSDSQENTHDYGEHDEDTIPDDSLENCTVEEDIFPLKTKCVTFKKRRNPRVIRFVNYNRAHDPENYCREKLLLYLPWRKEELLKGKCDSYVKSFETNETVIRKNMQKYEKFAEEVREAEDLIDAVNNENHDEIAPNIEQGERDDELVGQKDSMEYEFFRPPKQNETPIDVLYNAGVPGTDDNIETMAGFIQEDAYLDMVKSLNEKQFQIYTHILQHISRDESPLQVFITGGAGVGKSMVLRCIYQGLLRLLSKKEGQNPEAPRIIIAAPTGKAAYLVEGNTIHSILKILPSRGNEYIPLADEHKDSIRIKFKNLNTIIIDEVSMVGNNMLSFIHQRLQEIMGCYDKLFGGLNVILFGDLFQLRPVMDGWIFEDLAKPYNNNQTKKRQKKRKKLISAAALAPNIWRENFTCFELTEVMRQKDDQLFCGILNRMREGNHTEHDVNVIRRNCELKQNVEVGDFLHIPHFYHTNSERNTHNQKVLLAKEGQCISVKAIDICTQTNLPKKERERIEANVKKLEALHLTGNLETELQLKVGLPYDMTTNVDTEDGLVNGASLVLRGMLYLDKNGTIPSVLLVEAEDVRIGRKARKRWSYYIPPAIRQEHPGWIPIMSVHSHYLYLLKHPIKREQFPLTLAAGKTFHKSQGSSMKQAVLAFPENRKIEHLHYVGLSRVTEMSGVKILHGRFHDDKIHVNDRVKLEMSRLRSEAKLKLCFKPLSEIKSDFLVISFNAQSLHKHIENVKADWNMKAAMVIGICETRLKHGEDCSKYQMADFHFHHIDQQLESNQRPYHGVALYVKKAFKSQPMFHICTEKFECIAREIIIPCMQSTIQVIMCYKKPATSNSILFKVLEEITMVANLSQPLIVMGDFNINKQMHQTVTAKMSHILQCKQIISDATTKANTCIDLMFTNMKTASHGSIFTAVSHHNLTYAAFDDTKVNT